MIKILILLSIFPLLAFEINFIGPCSEEPLLKADLQNSNQSVGEVTLKALEEFNISFEGSPQGLVSAFGTPKGALEKISSNEFRAYGWCYIIDGFSPEKYPHEVYLSDQTENLTWYFGFALYRDGEWVEQCTPSYKIKSEFVCPLN